MVLDEYGAVASAPETPAALERARPEVMLSRVARSLRIVIRRGNDNSARL